MTRKQHQPLSAIVRTVLALAFLSTASVAVNAEQRGNDKARAALESAEAFIAQKNWRSARVELLNATTADPRWADAHIRLAEVALHLFDGVTAKAELQRAEALGVDGEQIAHLKGHALWLTGDLEQAEEILSRTPIAGEHLPYAYRILGRVQMARGDTVAASASFDEGLALAPNDSQLWTEIGRLRIVISNQGGAIQALDRAVELDPANIRALELRGRMVRTQFGMLAALPWFERGLQIDPNDVPLLEEYGATLGEAGRYQEMLAQARKILTLDTKNARAFYMQSVIAARAGKYALARNLADKMGGPFANLPAPQLLMAVCDYELGNFNKAVDRLGPLLDAQPDNAQIRLVLARAVHRSGDHMAAWTVIAPLADRPDADNYSVRLAARIQEALGERGPAAAKLDLGIFLNLRVNAALPSAPQTAAIAENAARNPGAAANVVPYIRLLLQQGRVDEARLRAGQLLAGNEGVAEAQLLVGDVETLAGNDAAAAMAYEKARSVKFTADVLQRLVAAYRRAGNAEAATAALQAYIGYNPNDPPAMRLWAFDLLDRQEWNEVLPWLYRLRLATGPNDVALNANIARALSALGKHKEAIYAAQIAYYADPANFMATHIYGQALLAAKVRPTDARDLLRKANKLAPADKAIRRDYLKAMAAAG